MKYSDPRIPGHFIYICRRALKNECVQYASQRGMRGERARHLKTCEALTTRSQFSFHILFAVRSRATSEAARQTYLYRRTK